MNSRVIRPSTTFLGLLLASCQPLAADEDLETQVLAYEAESSSCPSCGTNVATIGDGRIFDELHFPQTGVPQPNRGMIKIVGAETCDAWQIQGATLTCSTGPSKKVRLKVEGDRLSVVGSGVQEQLPEFIRQPLVNRLLIQLQDEETGAQYELLLTSDDTQEFWARPGAGMAPAYTFKYRKSMLSLEGQRRGMPVRLKHLGAIEEPVHPDFSRPICLGDYPEDQAARYRAFVFSGDRIHSGEKTVRASGPGDEGWFNLACAGSGMWKLHALRHTDAGGRQLQEIADDAATRLSQPEDRQAMVKMLSADYCGSGESFTRNGQPLRYVDHRGLFDGPHHLEKAHFRTTGDNLSFGEVEAIWSDTGAVCLNQPRLADVHPRDAIEAACNATNSRVIPPCAQTDVDQWRQLGRVISMHPPARWHGRGDLPEPKVRAPLRRL